MANIKRVTKNGLTVIQMIAANGNKIELRLDKEATLHLFVNGKFKNTIMSSTSTLDEFSATLQGYVDSSEANALAAQAAEAGALQYKNYASGYADTALQAKIDAEAARDASIAKVGATVVDVEGTSTANAISQNRATTEHNTHKLLDGHKIKVTKGTNIFPPIGLWTAAKVVSTGGALIDGGAEFYTSPLIEWGTATALISALNGIAASYYSSAQYDANGVFVAGTTQITGHVFNTMAKDANAPYFRISLRPAFVNQLNFGGTILAYEAYNQRVNVDVNGTTLVFKPDMTDAALLLALDGGIVRTDLSLLPPKKIYNVFNDLKGTGEDSLFDVRSHGATLYFDHLINGILTDLDVNITETGNEKITLFAPELTTNTSTVAKNIPFDKSTKYNAGSFDTIQKNVKESVGSALFPKIMCIGDSVTDGYLSQIANKAGLAQQYWSVIKEQFEQSKIDAGDAGHNCLMVGKTSSFAWSMTYGGVTGRSMKAFAEGIGGWSTSSHMFWSMNWQVRGEGLYDLLGRCGTGAAWSSATTAQKNLIYQTPEGKYAPTDTAAFLAYINSELSLSLTTYAQAVSALNALEANPVNPFYDYATASAVGSTVAFSMYAYQSRYKTLSQDGTTRLIVGSTAGSKVTVATAYDVCIPSHIIIQHSHNDGDVTWFADNMRIWTNAIKAEYAAHGWTTPFIGLSVIRHTGTYYPKRYPFLDRQYCSLWNSFASIGYNNTQRLITKYWVSDANEDTEKIYILPSMHIQPTAWSVPFRHVDSPAFDITGLPEHMYHIMDGSGGTYHPNAIAHRCWGMQMYGWIRWTLSL